jgi:hypothetical protein
MNGRHRIADALSVFCLAFLVTVLSGCDIIEGIFKIGFWAGVIIVALIVAAIFGVVKLFGR